MLAVLRPCDALYGNPPATALAIRRARVRGGRIIAVGTTVVRALEHAAGFDGAVRAGAGLATQRIGPTSHLRVVEAILPRVHQPAPSHYHLPRPFFPEHTPRR